MSEESIFFLQEEDVVCFFSHSFCMIEGLKKNKIKKKKSKMKLRACCETKCEIGVA